MDSSWNSRRCSSQMVVVLVKLELRNSSGEMVSENFYWLGAESASYRRLNRLPASSLSVIAKSTRAGDEIQVRVDAAKYGDRGLAGG